VKNPFKNFAVTNKPVTQLPKTAHH